MVKLPIARIEDVTEPDHDALSNVYFDKEHGELIAGDGFSMVVIPVDSGDKDVSGCIPVGVIEVARKHRANVGLHDSTKARVAISEGALWQKRYERYPENVREVISKALTGEDNCTVISLDVRKLIHLVEALLDRAHLDDCRVTLKIHGEEEPVLIRPYYDKVRDSRFGIIMPLTGWQGRKMVEEKDIIEDVVEETIGELQGLLREGDRLTITPKDARLVYYGELKALGVDVVASFLAREG